MLDDVSRRRLALPARGVEIALLDWGGDGPLALLHHANGFCAALWDLVARRLRAHFRVIAMDARGHGDSSRAEGEGAYAWPQFGADLAAVARALAEETGAPVALGLGHSFGGTAMLLAAAEATAVFERLVLVEPVLPPPPELGRLDPRRPERSGSLVERASRRRSVFPDREEARASWDGKDLFAAWRPEAFEIYLAEGLGDRPDGQVELKCAPGVEAAIFSNAGASGVWDAAAKLRVPTLLLWATDGDFPRPVYERYAEALGGAPIRDVEAGHLVPMEDPGIVVAHALDFCGRAGPAG